MTEQLYDVKVGLEYHEMDLALEDEGCEHMYHGSDTKYHTGEAGYYEIGNCPACGPKGVILVCSVYAEAMMKVARIERGSCTTCGYSGFYGEFVGYVRKSEWSK